MLIKNGPYWQWNLLSTPNGKSILTFWVIKKLHDWTFDKFIGSKPPIKVSELHKKNRFRSSIIVKHLISFTCIEDFLQTNVSAWKKKRVVFYTQRSSNFLLLVSSIDFYPIIKYLLWLVWLVQQLNMYNEHEKKKQVREQKPNNGHHNEVSNSFGLSLSATWHIHWARQNQGRDLKPNSELNLQPTNTMDVFWHADQ